jgi:hypothetical protein
VFPVYASGHLEVYYMHAINIIVMEDPKKSKQSGLILVTGAIVLIIILIYFTIVAGTNM